MTENLVAIEGRSVFVCSAEGALLRGTQAAIDLIGQVRSTGAEMVVVPVARLDPEFFQLRTGVAGEFLQKFVTYQVPIVILGDTSAAAAESEALRDFIGESNKREATWFLASMEDLKSRIGAFRAYELGRRSSRVSRP